MDVFNFCLFLLYFISLKKSVQRLNHTIRAKQDETRFWLLLTDSKCQLQHSLGSGCKFTEEGQPRAVVCEPHNAPPYTLRQIVYFKEVNYW